MSNEDEVVFVVKVPRNLQDMSDEEIAALLKEPVAKAVKATRARRKRRMPKGDTGKGHA